MKKYRYIICIDPGVNTGYAIWDNADKRFIIIDTASIHLVMDVVKKRNGITTLVRVEDARKRKWFGNAGREKLQGVGSIKRDCKIWEDFLIELGIKFELVAPKNNKTKLSADNFNKLTKWDKRTSQHARDAAMLAYGY